MASYSLRWKSSAFRELKRLDRQIVQTIVSEIESLAENPFPSQCKKLRGSEASYRLRIGDYRVIYQFDAHEKTVTVCHVRHRREAYRR